MEVRDPANHHLVGVVPDASPLDAEKAVEAAVVGHRTWRAHASRERSEVLYRAYELLRVSADRLALLMTREMGKPIAEARGEVAYAAEYLRWFAEEAVRFEGRYLPSPNGDGRILTTKQPVGPCYLITPWNYPLAMGARKIAPALAAGCSVIIKPAQQTPLTTLAMVSILEQAGVPAGVVNALTTSDARALSGPILADPRVRKLSFTGSTPVGRSLAELAGRGLMHVSLELGGNAPFVVFGDADIDSAVAGAMVAKMRNIGEACTAANRFLVEATVADEFTEKLAARMRALRVGPPTDEAVQVGPLVDRAQRQKVTALVDDALERGADVVVGGSAYDGPGYFYQPTVITRVPPDATILNDEIFGPVAPVTSFDVEDEAITLANATEHGLVAYIYTESLRRAIRLGDRLEAGMIALNRGLVANPAAPFGGIKASGLGREGGREGIEEYLETKYVAIDG
jgi:succinate-semialdehyde dehydrogenase/glutarate-semialdehyde dehydrogenase